MIRWEKRGRIFVPDGTSAWMKSHAQVPVADFVDDTSLRIYFGGRDGHNRARIGWIEVDPTDPRNVQCVSDHPILPLGERGTFDDNGMMPSCIVSTGNEKYMYYMGWNPQVSVPYRVAIGLAKSDDGGRTFYRYSPGPLLDRDREEPFFNTTPCVLRENDRWRMWYASCTGWKEVNGRAEPVYHVKYAESPDGVAWERTGIVCIDYDSTRDAIGRPWVVQLQDGYGMWFSYRRLVDYRTDPLASYRVGYAESHDGLRWEQRPVPLGLGHSATDWDRVMVCYTNVVSVRGRMHCFYNGNGFGHSGFGYAIEQAEGPRMKRVVA